MNRMNTGNGSREPACWSETADWSGCGMRTSSSSASAASAPMRRNSWRGPGSPSDADRRRLRGAVQLQPAASGPQLHTRAAESPCHAERLRQVNPDLDVQSRIEFIRESDVPELLAGDFDYAVDAIDSLGPKIAFLLECRRRKLPLISSMGAGGKTDPAQIRLDDISRTYGCALARAVRSRLREHRVSRGIKVVFSPEAVPKSAVESGLSPEGKQRSTVGTISYMPACFGCFCAGAVLRGLLQHQ